MIKKMTNSTPGFYELMGPIFGSRDIEKITGDRFFDDDDKIWYLNLSGERLMACISLKEDVIKNVLGFKEESLLQLLNEVLDEAIGGIVPNIYEHLYVEAGYQIVKDVDSKRRLIRFVPIQGRMPKEI